MRRKSVVYTHKKVNKVSKPAVPLKAYVEPTAFKLYIIDTGLLGVLSKLDVQRTALGLESGLRCAYQRILENASVNP